MTVGTLITVVPTGISRTPAEVPALPVNLVDLLVTAKECEALGASVLTVHGQDAAGRPAPVFDSVRAIVREVRSATDLVIQVGTDGPAGEGERLRLLETGPDLASCALGERWEFVVALHIAMRDLGVVPGYEVTDRAQIAVLDRLLAEHGLPYGGKVHVTLLLETPAEVFAAVTALPSGATCSVAGPLPVLMTGLALDAHLRVGLADTTAWSPRQPVESNMQLVARAVSFAQLAQRPPLTTKEARELLGVSPR